MRYGSIPVVRKTGGLYDTVFDVDHDKERADAQGVEPNGFSFDGADAAGVDYALNRAISAWYDGRDWFNSLCKTVMEQDWSWNKPALDYVELYHAARKLIYDIRYSEMVLYRFSDRFPSFFSFSRLTSCI
ncbi:hypothetical protein ACE6H2_012980 [Prunus campanulata]